MKFQDKSIHGSKVIPCTRKRDERTIERTDKPKAICPQLFQSWEHKDTGFTPVRSELKRKGHFSCQKVKGTEATER